VKITLLGIGKTNASYLNTGIQEYEKRLKRYCPFTLTFLPDVKNASKLPLEQLKIAEGQQFIKQLDPTDYLVLLDEQGKSFRSVELSKHILKKQHQGIRRMVVLIGGAYGFSDEVYARANEKWSLSKMTFSHQMVRLFAVEQLYRAFTIAKGEPYHHE